MNAAIQHVLQTQTAVTAQQQSANIMLCGELPVSSSIVEPDAHERKEIESFVSEMFHKVHQANIKHFMPKLLSLRDNQKQLRAVCGLRHAHEESLFLECYLEAPIEHVLSEQTGLDVKRSDILEIGNLAILEPACIRSLLASVSVYLHKTDAKWAVFTSTTVLRNALKKLQMPLHLLGEAKITCLPESEREDWGRYYDQRPQVIAIPRLH